MCPREVHGSVDDGKGTSWLFEAIASGQAPSSELIRELEQLSLGLGQCPQQPSPSPSDAGSWGGSSTSTPGGAVSPPPAAPMILEQVEHAPGKFSILDTCIFVCDDLFTFFMPFIPLYLVFSRKENWHFKTSRISREIKRKRCRRN